MTMNLSHPPSRISDKFMLDPTPYNQHRTVGLMLNVVITHRTTPFKRRFNLMKADWKTFVGDLDSCITGLPSTHNNYDGLVELLKASFRKNILWECRTNGIQELSNTSEDLYEEYKKFLQDDPFGSNTLACGDALTNSITKCRELIESTNMTHRKAWKTIWILGDDYTYPSQRLNLVSNRSSTCRGNRSLSSKTKFAQITRRAQTRTLQKIWNGCHNQSYQKQQECRSWRHPCWLNTWQVVLLEIINECMDSE